MPFSFFNPWFWLGALAIGAPIWLHLRRRRETNLLRFSALRFLDDNPEPRRSPMRLRDVLLFAARALALLLVVAGFAWPYLPAVNRVPIRESRVYVLDNTMSHQANDGFVKDRQRVLSEISAAGRDVQVAVVELAATPRVIVAFGDDRETARQRVEQTLPSHQRGSYLAAFRQANSLLANSLGEHKRLIFLGDNQENQWHENVNTPPFLRDVEVEIPKPEAQVLPNLSLSEPRVQRIFLGDKSLINFTVKLSRVGQPENANIILRANGQVIFNRAVELAKQPESMMLQAQWEADPMLWLKGDVTVEGADVLPADNKVFFSLPPVVEGKVALLAQSPYLRLALSRDIMRGQWDARILDPAKLTAETDAGKDADVLCLESNYLQSSEARKLLWRYLSNGRGVILFVNRVTPTINGYLRELGFESEGAVRTPAGNSEKFQFILFNHPVFHPFLSPDYGNLTDIRVSQYYRLRASEAMPLIFGERGEGLFFQGGKSAGKLFVAAFGMERDQTSWPVHQTFIPFLDLALQTARAEDPTPTTFEPGEMSIIQLPASLNAREVVLHDERGEIARARLEQGKAQLRLPDMPGLYTLTCDQNDRVEKVFSVNPSPKESQLTYADSGDALKLWRMNPAEVAKTKPSSARTQVRVAGVLQQRLWWWMVLGGLAMLLAEMTLAAAARRAA